MLWSMAQADRHSTGIELTPLSVKNCVGILMSLIESVDGNFWYLTGEPVNWGIGLCTCE